MNEIERLKSIDVNGAIKKALVEQEKSKSLDELGQLREARFTLKGGTRTMLAARGIITEYKAANTCEWIKYDYRTMCPKNHGDVDNPYWRIPTNMKHLLYCPYCGKKIRQSEQNRDKAYIEAKDLFKDW